MIRIALVTVVLAAVAAPARADDGDKLYACNLGMFHEDEMCFSVPSPALQLE